MKKILRNELIGSAKMCALALVLVAVQLWCGRDHMRVPLDARHVREGIFPYTTALTLVLIGLRYLYFLIRWGGTPRLP